MAFGERKKLLVSFIEEVWSQGRIEACDDFIGETYTIRHDPGDPRDGLTLSRDAFKERVRTSRDPFIAGFAATGARLTMSGLTLYDFDGENRIRGHWQVVDRLGVFQQLAQNVAKP
jgi:hypothetical protein